MQEARTENTVRETALRISHPPATGILFDYEQRWLGMMTKMKKINVLNYQVTHFTRDNKIIFKLFNHCSFSRDFNPINCLNWVLLKLMIGFNAWFCIIIGLQTSINDGKVLSVSTIRENRFTEHTDFNSVLPCTYVCILLVEMRIM